MQDTPEDGSNPCINILLLGETGIGKSTFINSFANYQRFATFDEAKSSTELIHVIPVKFPIFTSKNKEVIITSGDVDDPSTRAPKAYTFKLNDCANKLIRIIDTPGIGNGRSHTEEQNNLDAIFRFASQFSPLDAICFFLRPNVTINGYYLQFCIVETLTKLVKVGKSIGENVIFIFTNTRGTDYAAPDTVANLRTMLSNLKRDYNIDVPLNTARTNPEKRRNIFCLDNEGFKYLMAARQNESYGNVATMRESWLKSSKVIAEWLEYIGDGHLLPREMERPLSLNEVRKVIKELSQELLQITDIIRDKVAKFKNEQERLQEEIFNCEHLMQFMGPSMSMAKRPRTDFDDMEKRRLRIEELKKKLRRITQNAKIDIEVHIMIEDCLKQFEYFLKQHERVDLNKEYLQYLDDLIAQAKLTPEDDDNLKKYEFQKEESLKKRVALMEACKSLTVDDIMHLVDKLFALEVYGLAIQKHYTDIKREVQRKQLDLQMAQSECFIDITNCRQVAPQNGGHSNPDDVLSGLTVDQITAMLDQGNVRDAFKALLAMQKQATKVENDLNESSQFLQDSQTVEVKYQELVDKQIRELHSYEPKLGEQPELKIVQESEDKQTPETNFPNARCQDEQKYSSNGSIQSFNKNENLSLRSKLDHTNMRPVHTKDVEVKADQLLNTTKFSEKPVNLSENYTEKLKSTDSMPETKTYDNPDSRYDTSEPIQNVANQQPHGFLKERHSNVKKTQNSDLEIIKQSAEPTGFYHNANKEIANSPIMSILDFTGNILAVQSKNDQILEVVMNTKIPGKTEVLFKNDLETKKSSDFVPETGIQFTSDLPAMQPFQSKRQKPQTQKVVNQQPEISNFPGYGYQNQGQYKTNAELETIPKGAKVSDFGHVSNQENKALRQNINLSVLPTPDPTFNPIPTQNSNVATNFTKVFGKSVIAPLITKESGTQVKSDNMKQNERANYAQAVKAQPKSPQFQPNNSPQPKPPNKPSYDHFNDRPKPRSKVANSSSYSNKGKEQKPSNPPVGETYRPRDNNTKKLKNPGVSHHNDSNQSSGNRYSVLRNLGEDDDITGRSHKTNVSSDKETHEMLNQTLTKFPQRNEIPILSKASQDNAAGSNAKTQPPLSRTNNKHLQKTAEIRKQQAAGKNASSRNQHQQQRDVTINISDDRGEPSKKKSFWRSWCTIV